MQSREWLLSWTMPEKCYIVWLFTLGCTTPGFTVDNVKRGWIAVWLPSHRTMDYGLIWKTKHKGFVATYFTLFGSDSISIFVFYIYSQYLLIQISWYHMYAISPEIIQLCWAYTLLLALSPWNRVSKMAPFSDVTTQVAGQRCPTSGKPQCRKTTQEQRCLVPWYISNMRS